MSEFYKYPQMADGHLNLCKECRRAQIKKYNNTPKGKEVQRLRNQKPNRIANRIKNTKKWRKKHLKRWAAHIKVNDAVRNGSLTKPNTCEECGFEGHIHGHHDDYDKPLKVRWLCPTCHAAHHEKDF